MRQDINSVFISRDSVFDTPEAQDLTRILLAIANPRDTTCLKAALITQTLGLDAQSLYQLSRNDEDWMAINVAFEQYRATWVSRGFMPMFYQLIHEQGVAARLLSTQNGSRPLTNLLQLAELIHLEARHHAGIETSIRWLSAEISSSDENNEDQQLRLESDENLVQIVTIHKSKGLQYPILFLPYLWASRPLDGKGILSYHHEATTDLHLDLGSEERERHLALARKESLAEDLRLLYVALTRAEYRCYFAWGQLAYADSSGLAWLLHQSHQGIDQDTGRPAFSMSGLTDDEIKGDLDSLCLPAADSFLIQDLPSRAPEQAAPRQEEIASYSARVFSGDCRQRWQTTSFTQLASRWHHTQAQEILVEMPDYDATVLINDQDMGSGHSRFSFPKGAHTGEFLHSILENIDLASASGDSLDTIILQQSQRFGIDAQWHTTLNDWLTDILNTQLDRHSTLSLKDITTDRRLVEFAFQYPVSQLSTDALTRILSQHRQAPVPQLALQSIQGMMKGFIDLVFEHEGKFYIADYKSNYLGDSFQDYRLEALLQAMQSHDYDLQYLIYTVALHRYLRNRIRDYSYESHFGGVYYLFLRGMTTQSDAVQGIYFSLPDTELIDDLDTLFAGKEQGRKS